eukprot:10273342-Prorocentrum_lima.AAC.1
MSFLSLSPRDHRQTPSPTMVASPSGPDEEEAKLAEHPQAQVGSYHLAQDTAMSSGMHWRE